MAKRQPTTAAALFPATLSMHSTAALSRSLEEGAQKEEIRVREWRSEEECCGSLREIKSTVWAGKAEGGC